MFRLHSIKAKDPLSDMTLGQRVGLSFFDAKLANLAYCAGKSIMESRVGLPRNWTSCFLQAIPVS